MNFWKIMAQTPYWRGKGRLALAVLRRTRGLPALAYTPNGGRMWIGWDSASFLLLPYLIGKYERRTYQALAGEWARMFYMGEWFVDVGANIGWYTVAAMAAGVKVVAIEPNDDAYAKLWENLRINIGRVVPYLCAASDSAGAASLHYNRHAITTGSLACLPGLTAAHQVYVDTIDEMARRPVGLIKADIEGGELGALQGARRILAEDGPVVVYEENDEFCLAFGHRPGDAQRFLEGLGYEVGVVELDKSTGTRNMVARRVA